MTHNGAKNPKIVFRLSHMGDVALTTGVLSHWQEVHCDTFIFITRSGNAPLLERHPAVQDVITLDDAILKGKAWLKEAPRLASLYQGHTLLDLHGTLRSRILSFFWKGEVKRYPKFGLERRLYDRTHAEVFRKRLEATTVPQRYAMAYGEKPAQAERLVPRIYLSEFEKDDAALRLQHLTGDRPLVAIHPYATHPAKQWPRAHWKALTGLLASADMDWIIVGRDKEPLIPGHDHDLTNKTDLRETCALLSQADLLVTADSGPMHLASGVDTPSLAMFGPTAKVWGFYPAGPLDRVLEKDLNCRPCSLHGGKPCEKGYECLAGITPEEVLENVAEMLKR
ncbi:glycosyltransferase family 9 protein [Pseudodesulfovibrio sp. zrk46]|nr:glycosyltransferase family 9 protein [Pseudodesulfovibrio sp. zrk46]